MSPSSELIATAMQEAVTFALEHVQAGGLPFVGVLLLADGTVSEPGTNEVRETGDPSAHAEIVAIRAALRLHPSVRGAVLLATGEPCALCYHFAASHGIAQVIYAVDADEAARYGFDYRGTHISTGGQALDDGAQRLHVAGATQPFTTMAALANRKER